ncbi:MAG: amidophosphoribosyltransferase [Acidobacteriota bacterium]
MCGFVGIVQSEQCAAELLDGLVAIQHRGQDAAGALTLTDDGEFRLHKNEGLVRDVFAAPDDLSRLEGKTGIGHVRYPTVGSGGVTDAQPFQTLAPLPIAMVHNGNVTNVRELAEWLETEHGRTLESRCDVEALMHVYAVELETRLDGGEFGLDAHHDAVAATLERVKGAYSVVGLVAGHGLFAFRDSHGIKPIVTAWREVNGQRSWCVASESVVPDLLGFPEKQDVVPGESLFYGLDGSRDSRRLTETNHAPCVFEHVYFARPDSFLDEVSVYKTRKRMGESLARQVERLGWDVDVVIPVPESSCTAALALAQALDRPYREGLVKNRYIGRTFIMPGQVKRKRSVRHKLNAIDLEFEAKNVLLVDDSIVRGTTSGQIVAMAREAGAARVYFASCSPPLRHPCVYGIDMSTRSELVATDRDTQGVADVIGADGLVYQGLDDLVDSVRAGNPELQDTCHACFSGCYPTGDVDAAMLGEIADERLAHRQA